MNGTGSSMTDVVAATDSLVMLSVAFHPAVIVPTITGNGSGLTNLQAASLVGNIAAANLPGGGGLTTNITTGSYTLYITNGLILRVSGP